MQGNESYRQYLQYHANNHPSATKRAEAQALLNVTGDDGGLNGYFLMGNGTNNRGQTVGEQKSNGYTASSLNRSVNPWWMNSYANWRQAGVKDPGPNNQPGGGNRASAAQLAEYDQNNTCAIILSEVHCSYSPLSKDCTNI